MRRAAGGGRLCEADSNLQHLVGGRGGGRCLAVGAAAGQRQQRRCGSNAPHVWTYHPRGRICGPAPGPLPLACRGCAAKLVACLPPNPLVCGDPTLVRRPSPPPPLAQRRLVAGPPAEVIEIDMEEGEEHTAPKGKRARR